METELKGDNEFALGKKQKPLNERFQLSPAITPEIQNNQSYLQRSPHISPLFIIWYQAPGYSILNGCDIGKVIQYLF